MDPVHEAAVQGRSGLFVDRLLAVAIAQPPRCEFWR